MRDLILNLPVADLVSVCLDAFHPRVEMIRLPGRPGDTVLWNGQPLGPPHLARFERVLRRVREMAGSDANVLADVSPGLPHRVGLAGSAAAMAAFSYAAEHLLGLELDKRELSELARLGSGSAARSVPDGFVLWHKGIQADGSDSVGESVASSLHWPDFRMILVSLDDRPKAVSSTEGMIRTARTSPHFDGWTRQCQALSVEAVEAIRTHDFGRLAQVSETSARTLHGLVMTAVPSILYVSQRTMGVLEAVHEMQERIPVFYTLDAGPNPVVFTLAPHLDDVLGKLAGKVPGATLLACGVGSGAALAEDSP